MDEDRQGPPNGLHVETLLANALGAFDAASYGVIPGIHPATTFLREGDLSYRGGHSYARPHNPTFLPAEHVVARLEGAAEALLFSSGMAAATAVFQTLTPGAHAVVPKVMYWSLRNWVRAFAAQWQVAVDFVDMTDLAAVDAVLRPGTTQLVWAETPANPTWDVTDVAALAKLAHGAGAILAVDATAATPILLRSLDLGADIVMHSATKYLNGHSDVLAGVLATRETTPLWERIRAVRYGQGGIPGPFEAWLLLRGLRTLALRVERASANALAIATSFQDDPRLEAVLYPGLPEHPGHAIAARQMHGGFDGMLSVRVKGGWDAARDAAARMRVWTRATSLGGVESLVEHRSSVEGPDSPCPPNLLRLSCGIENAADLIADLDRALG